MAVCKYTLIILCIWCFASQGSFAQNARSVCQGKIDTVLHKFVYTIVDRVPEPEGGLAKIGELIGKNIKYPANFDDYYGTVIIGFVVEENGKLDGLRVFRDRSPDQEIAKQFFKIVNMVKWKPGICKGRPVPVLYSAPLTICVSSSE